MKIKIIFEDKNILILEKPPKVPCQSDKTSDENIMSMLKRPYLGLVHRLDRPVGGVMVYAKTKKANSHLSTQISQRNLHKEYLAIVCGIPENNKGELRNYLKKLKTINMSKVVPESTSGAKEAILTYKVLQTINTEEHGQLSLLKIILKTGRHHQIRVQLSNANLPIWGDNKYNKTFTKRKGWTQIALWAHKISFTHPTKNTPLSFLSFPYNEYPWNLFDAINNKNIP